MGIRSGGLRVCVLALLARPGSGQANGTCVPRSCPAGHQLAAARGLCEPCPAGKQSSGALGEHCEACPHTLEMVTVGESAFGSGCQCRRYHASPWPAGSSSPTSCLSCGEVTRLAGDDPRRVSCEPCVDTLAGVGCVGSERTCECAGGERGKAFMCAAEGYYLMVDQAQEAAAGRAATNAIADEVAHEWTIQRAYKLLRCAKLGATQLGSRCRHWRSCRPAPNATCQPERRSLPGFGDYYAMECCAEGYRGPLCEHCEEGYIQGGGGCLRCTRTNWELLSLTLMCCFFLVAYVMRTSLYSFEEASGMSSILIFFLQTAAMAVKHRIPDIAGLTNFMDFNFMKPGGFGGPGSCMIAVKGFYYQWTFGIAAMPVALLLVYGIVILTTYMYSHQASIHRKVRLHYRQIRSVQLLDKVLSEQPVFRVLHPAERHLIATRMKLQAFPQHHDLVRQGESSASGFFVIVEGECAVKVNGEMVKELHAGHSFGELALLSHSARTSTVTALQDVYVGQMSPKEFATVLEEIDVEGKVQMQLDKMKAGHQGVTLHEAISQQVEHHSNMDLVSDPDSRNTLSEMEMSEMETQQELKRQELQNMTTNAAISLQYSVARYKAGGELDHLEVKEIRINDRCCLGCCHHLQRNTRVNLSVFFRACQDPIARKCGLMEISIILYATMTQELMTLWMCSESLFDSSMEVLAVDPTVHCHGTTYQTAFYGSIVMWVLVAFGVPVYMQVTAARFSQQLETEHLRPEAEQMQKAVYVASWNQFDETQKEKLIETAMHDLKIQKMSAECFLLSKFQMSLSKRCGNWYQQWYMGRRLLLNILFLASEWGVVDTKASVLGDWRMSALLMLATSSMLQYHFRPFRSDAENR